MKLTLESTATIGTIIVNGAQVPARVWEGVTERGTKCFAYITRITPGQLTDPAEFQAELRRVDDSTEAVSDPFLPLVIVISDD